MGNWVQNLLRLFYEMTRGLDVAVRLDGGTGGSRVTLPVSLLSPDVQSTLQYSPLCAVKYSVDRDCKRSYGAGSADRAKTTVSQGVSRTPCTFTGLLPWQAF